jgi:hypothetical protein
MVRPSFVACALAVLGGGATAAEAQAEPPKAIALDYGAAAGCPDRAAFVGMIAARTELARIDGEEPTVRLVIAIEPRARGGATGHLRLASPERTITRTVEGDACEEVANALALITALAVDPSPRAIEASPAPPPADSSPAEPAAGPIEQPSPAAPPPIIPLRTPWRPPPRADRAPAGPAGPGVDASLGAAFALDVGPAKLPLVGGAVSLEIRMLTRIAWSLRGSGVFETSPTFDFGGLDADFSLLRGRLDGCVYRFHPVRAFSLWPCALAEAGAMEGSLLRHEPPRASESTTPWGALGVFARAELAPANGITFELDVGPSFPLRPAKYLFGSKVLYDTPPAELSLALGLMLRP